MLILDTHTWIWLINGNDKIEKKGYIEIVEHKKDL
jgi:PIN domain nuclease of toxin-antitoxin system